jgi:hypothetical protein
MRLALGQRTAFIRSDGRVECVLRLTQSAGEPAQSRRFATAWKVFEKSRQRLECGRFSAAFPLGLEVGMIHG